jgi:Domain of unknown function (DUF4337)
MTLDPMETVEQVKERAETSDQKSRNQLNNLVAVTVAILATFSGICDVKDGNIVQGMQQAQADKIDHWSYYQARNIREEVARSTIAQLQLQAAANPSQSAGYAKVIKTYEEIANKQNKEKDKLKAQAEADQKTYDDLNIHDDQFDLSGAAISIAISLLALTALTNKKWLYWVSLFPTGFGLVMGIAGLFGLGIHPNALSKLLSQDPTSPDNAVQVVQNYLSPPR